MDVKFLNHQRPNFQSGPPFLRPANPKDKSTVPLATRALARLLARQAAREYVAHPGMANQQ